MKLIKRCLILLALVLAQIPASVLALLCQPKPDCSMPCCAVKAVQPKAQVKRTCAMCPDEVAADSIDSSKSLETQISADSGPDPCPCKVAPRTSPPEHSSTACFTSSSAPDQEFDACMDPKPLRFELAILIAISPGNVGTDSGPPTHEPSCVWLGRAPPVSVA